MKTRAIILWILILVMIDQSIKLIILNYFVDSRFDIIPSLLEFKPTFNIRHSWVNNLLNNNLGLNVGLWPHVIIYLLMGMILPAYFAFYKEKLPSRFIDISAIFIMAALLCALIGNLLWKSGTLDYIHLIPFFVFDLKDLYVDFGIALFFLYYIKNRKLFNFPMKTADVYRFAKDRISR